VFTFDSNGSFFFTVEVELSCSPRHPLGDVSRPPLLVGEDTVSTRVAPPLASKTDAESRELDRKTKVAQTEKYKSHRVECVCTLLVN